MGPSRASKLKANYDYSRKYGPALRGSSFTGTVSPEQDTLLSRKPEETA